MCNFSSFSTLMEKGDASSGLAWPLGALLPRGPDPINAEVLKRVKIILILMTVEERPGTRVYSLFG